MDISEFRVEAFRSVLDTGWQALSVDSITALVGQNESGKSSILDGLELGYCVIPEINADDFRLNNGYPKISLRVSLSDDDVTSLIDVLPKSQQDSLRKELEKHRKDCVIVSRVVEEEGRYKRRVTFSDELMALLAPFLTYKEVSSSDEAEDASVDGASDETQKESSGKVVDVKEEFIEELWSCIPAFTLFNEAACSLPNRIDIKDGALAKDAGSRGANNFLVASELPSDAFTSGDSRRRDAVLSKASASVTRELQQFWTQVLGRSDRISLHCELRNHPESEGDKAGKSYLAFWIKEGDEPLYPSQRSRGTRWFISFFLELMASSKKHPGRIILLDEPANFLHPAAQEDVIRLLEKLAEHTKIIYSTHSPYMLDQAKLHRVLAVERQAVAQGSTENVTIVRRGLELAAASQFTLAPILGLMGVDLSQQQIVKRTRNVVLEEISGQYYLKAFLKLLGTEAQVHLVPCGGADTVKTIVDLFIAWGIKFTVLVDGDQHGKRVVRDIKSKYQIGDEDAKRLLQTIDGYDGVEDLFSKHDFVTYVLGKDEKFESRNSAYAKKNSSKPVLALNFWKRVEAGEIALTDLEDETVDAIREVVSKLLESLDSHQPA